MLGGRTLTWNFALKKVVLLTSGWSNIGFATRAGEQKQIIEHGINGFIAKNEEEWYTNLSMLIGDYALRKNIGQKGRETACAS